MRKKLVMFDLDGTLIDSREDLANGINRMLKDFGRASLPLEVISSYIGNGEKVLVERCLGVEQTDVEEEVACYKKHYAEHLVEKTYLYPGVFEGVKRMHDAGCTLAVVTNKLEVATKKVLDILGIAPYFSYILGGGGAFPLKPNPDGLLYLLGESSVPKSEAVMVGDNYTDLEAGRRAGVETVLVTYGFGDPKTEMATYTMSDFDELVKFILGES